MIPLVCPIHSQRVSVTFQARCILWSNRGGILLDGIIWFFSWLLAFTLAKKIFLKQKIAKKSCNATKLRKALRSIRGVLPYFCCTHHQLRGALRHDGMRRHAMHAASAGPLRPPGGPLRLRRVRGLRWGARAARLSIRRRGRVQRAGLASWACPAHWQCVWGTPPQRLLLFACGRATR